MEKKDHEFCLRCGRKLKNLEARERGYGAICFRKIQVAEKFQLFDPDQKSPKNQHFSTLKH